MSYETIVSELKNPDGWVRLKALETLASSDDERCMSLMQVLQNDSHKIRWQIADVCKTADADMQSALVRSLNDANWWDKLRVPWALAMIGDSDGVETLIGFLDIEDKITRLATIYLLGNLGDRRLLISFKAWQQLRQIL